MELPKVQLIYASKAKEFLGLDHLEEILSVSCKKNYDHGISGALCFDSKYFLQLLEGPSQNIYQLYKNILKDHRHEDVSLIGQKGIVTRAFPHWDIAYVSLDKMKEKNVSINGKSVEEFNPYHMTHQECLSFLDQITDKFV